MDITWNPADKDSGITLSNGDLTATTTGAWTSVRATASKTSGKHYFEVYIDELAYMRIGLATAAEPLNQAAGSNPYGWAYEPDNGLYYHYPSASSYGLTSSVGDTVMVAVDIDAGKIWIGKNGTWFNDGDPAAGTDPMVTDAEITAVFPILSLYLSGATANFGATAFSYTPPSGFAAYDSSNVVINDALDVADLIMSNSWDSIDESLSLIDILAEKYLLSNEESAILTDFSRGGFRYEKETESILMTSDIPLFLFALSIIEDLNLADGIDYGIFEEIIESLILTDLTRAIDFLILLDVIFGYDNAFVGWDKTVPDGFSITDIVTKILGVPCPDSLTLMDNIVTKWVGQEIVNQALGIYDLPKDILQYAKTIEDGFSAVDVVTYRLAVTIIENILMTELASAIKDLYATVDDTANIGDEATKGFDTAINESLVNTDIVAVITSFFNSIAESLGLADVPSFTGRLSITASESLVLADTVVSKGSLYTVIYESLGLLAEVEFAGETWECYVLNTPKFYPSMYSGFNFNSYAVFENRAFGANDIGIYELTGATDAGATIRTGVVLNDTDFGAPNNKRFRRAYLGISGDAPKMVFECEDGKREVYDIDTQGKTVVSSELKSKNWKLSISDFEDLSSIKLIPVILTK